MAAPAANVPADAIAGAEAVAQAAANALQAVKAGTTAPPAQQPEEGVISSADDLYLKDWSEARATIGRLDGYLATLRQYGFTLVSGFITGSVLLTSNGGAVSGQATRAAVASSLMVLVLALFGLDRSFCVLRSGAVERAIDIEAKNPGLRITSYIARNSIVSGAGSMALVLYLALLSAALGYGLGVLDRGTDFEQGGSISYYVYLSLWALASAVAVYGLQRAITTRRGEEQTALGSPDMRLPEHGALSAWTTVTLLVTALLALLGFGITLFAMAKLFAGPSPAVLYEALDIGLALWLLVLGVAPKVGKADWVAELVLAVILLVVVAVMGFIPWLEGSGWPIQLNRSNLYYVALVFWACLTLMLVYFLYTTWASGTESRKKRA